MDSGKNHILISLDISVSAIFGNDLTVCSPYKRMCLPFSLHYRG